MERERERERERESQKLNMGVGEGKEGNLPSFLPPPLPLLLLAPFLRCNSLFPNPTETLATQATLKTRQMFSIHPTPEEFTNATMAGHFGFWICVLRTTPLGKSHALVFEKRPFQNVFRLNDNGKPKSSVFVTDY